MTEVTRRGQAADDHGRPAGRGGGTRQHLRADATSRDTRSPPLLPRFLACTARTGVLPAGARVIAAVSGGADSTCLLHLLLEARGRLGLDVEVAHVNHRLRGGQSDRDAAAVAAAAEAAGLRFHLRTGDAFTPRQRRTGSLQERAREARLEFLLGLARRRRAIVALAHTADDQAETLLMRFLGGAGPAGLGGIPPSSHGGRITHPLLFARRSEIERWLLARAVRWRTDRSNRSRKYLRNRVRLDLLPAIARGYNPRIVERMGALAEMLRRDNDFIEAHAARLLERAAEGPRRFCFPPRVMAGAHPAVLSRALLGALRTVAGSAADFSHRHVEALLAPGTGARAWDLPGGVACRSDGAGLRLARADAAAGRPSRRRTVNLPVPGTAALAGGGVMTARTVARRRGFDPQSFGRDPSRVALDLESVRPPLEIRARLPGDRFRPLGLEGNKKLQDLFVDAKVPAGRRDRLPLVCDREGIVWAAGLRPAERCRVRAGTRRLLVLEHEPGGERDDVRPAARAPAGARSPAGRRAGRR